MYTYTSLSGKIMFFSEETHQDGELILRGRYQFTSAAASEVKPAQKDEVAFKCKGKPALEIKASGMYSIGVAEGYVDIKLETVTVKGQTLKEKRPTFVIRNWYTSSDLFPPTVFEEEVIVDEDEAAIDEDMLAQSGTSTSDIDEEFNSVYNPEQAPRPAVSFSF